MNLREYDGIVDVGDVSISGFLERRKKCQFCGFSPVVYIDDCDAYACPRCHEWLETACSDPACTFCRSRPELPFDSDEPE